MIGIENIIYKDTRKKHITICARCEGKNKCFTEKWDREGYEVSHAYCKNCLDDYFN